ncbi:transcriptional regulator [Staphylococcus hominis]|uniref:Transcriptional regulator n=1 Tax=Staphylococcus hominis TaxID=1290 RepID=A0A974KWG2_STAHO|nr:redox-sensitive transcriptional regulator HypR [Staphylococcus hominis]MCE4949945.1 Rrf2 family transcriptional regulator [Staphylococcus hominis]MCE4952474.1 Rrf2 family transcriptional regulator [Staphylococcus hominis]MCE4974818.1 Rrf2 family transcriptional regulator [Staphylococcus hominis]PTK23261.1 transcriptional regulator [Staphylococcus hominis]PTK24926.1 transcriptional regulator [Staphylococcus hominis]
MNLEFNIAVHVLTFLSKHSSERFSSVELSSKVCVNPVQLRRVMSKLLEEGYITTQKGKYGGYRINGNVLDTPLSNLFKLFASSQSFGRIYTGTKESDCKISNEMSRVMSNYHRKEFEIIERYYQNISIGDILNDILMEGYNEKV